MGRRASFGIRMETERGRRLDRAFAAAAADLDARERGFAHELAYGTTRLRGRLDHLLAPHVHRGLHELDPAVREVLRLGAYQVLYMGGVPTFAAVSESVELVRERAGPGPTGLVNAVLRRIAEGGDDHTLFPDRETDPVGFLSAWGSHPEWLVRRWLARWPVPDVSALVEANNTRPSTSIVGLGRLPAEVAGLLATAGILAEPVGEGTACVRLATGVSPAEALAVVPKSFVQDPAANLVAAYADVPEGTKVADLCASPGGKVLAVSDRPVYTLAADRSEARIHMLRDNVRRTGRPIGCVVADALRPPLREADVVLLDVPCSGTGTLARHPDARWRLAPESMPTFAALQTRMLDVAAGLLPPRGLLVYSTCTLEPEENENRVEAFVTSHPGFRVEATAAVPSRYLDASGRLVVTPQATGFDGAFAARLRRVA